MAWRLFSPTPGPCQLDECDGVLSRCCCDHEMVWGLTQKADDEMLDAETLELDWVEHVEIMVRDEETARALLALLEGHRDDLAEIIEQLSEAGIVVEDLGNGPVVITNPEDV